jgi:TolB protein
MLRMTMVGMIANIVAICLMGAVRLDPSHPLIAFESNRAGNWDIYLYDLTRARLHNLTPQNPYDDRGAAWSADGRYLAFQSLRADHPGAEIFILDVFGGDLRQLTRTGSNNSDPAWSPDGTQIAFVFGYGLIRLIGVDGVGEYELARGFNPEWSPDGAHVLYASFRSNYEQGIYIVDADGGESRPVFALGILDLAYWSPSWSPDNRYVAFVSESEGNPEIYRVDVACVLDLAACDRRPMRLTVSPRRDISPSWSPDSRALAFACDTPAGSAICVMDADGVGLHIAVVPTMGEHYFAPAWRPNG